jgi:DHA1 family bicyclomycin/chloramphenicol resistance-like MFS transporter
MLGPFTMDLYLPAFPEVQHDLAASQAGVQFTLTATAIGMGVGQILVGPLSDALGRRLPLLLATGLHVVASCAVAFAPGIAIVSVARFGQGLGAAAGAVVTVAIIRDLFGGYRLVRMLASIAMIGGLAPIIAPVLGSQLLLVMLWRGVFWLLAGFGLAIVIACALVVPETLPVRVHGESERVTMFARVRVILADRAFVGVAVIAAMVFASVITYLSMSPFLFQDGFGLDAQQFGLLFAVNALGLLGATQVSARLMRWWEPAWMLAGVLTAMLVSGMALILLGLSHAPFLSVATASFVFVSASGFANPCMSVLTLKDHRGRAGTAAAITGFANSIVGGAVSPLPGLLGGARAASLGIVVLAAMIVAMLALWLVLRPWTVSRLSRD